LVILKFLALKPTEQAPLAIYKLPMGALRVVRTVSVHVF
jgi:hypothetical protein